MDNLLLLKGYEYNSKDKSNNKNIYYQGNKYSTKVVSLNCSIVNDINNIAKIDIGSINFNNIYEAFQLFYIATLNVNYYLSKYAYEYITKTLKMSDLINGDFYVYLNPIHTYFPYSKMIYTALYNIQNEVDKSQIFNLLILNKHTPDKLKMKKIFFDKVCSNTHREPYQILYPQRFISTLESGNNTRIGFQNYIYKGKKIIGDIIDITPLKLTKVSEFKDKYEHSIHSIIINFILRQIDYDTLTGDVDKKNILLRCLQKN